MQLWSFSQAIQSAPSHTEVEWQNFECKVEISVSTFLLINVLQTKNIQYEWKNYHVLLINKSTHAKPQRHSSHLTRRLNANKHCEKNYGNHVIMSELNLHTTQCTYNNGPHKKWSGWNLTNLTYRSATVAAIWYTRNYEDYNWENSFKD